MTDLFERSLIIHEQLRGKIGIYNKMPITQREDLALSYTPGRVKSSPRMFPKLVT